MARQAKPQVRSTPYNRSAKWVADYLGVSERHVRNMFDSGELPGVRLSERGLRFNEDDVREFIAARMERDQQERGRMGIGPVVATIGPPGSVRRSA